MKDALSVNNRSRSHWESMFYAIAFATGAAGLTYEVLWNRYLLLILGSTTRAAAGILAVFIGGLAIGSFWGARTARRFRKPLLVYTFLEAAIAMYALALVPWLAYINQGGNLATRFSPAAASLLMLLTFFSLLVPTVAMGASFPFLVLARSLAAGESEKAPALFYGWDTLGAVAGALSAGFFLIPLLGMKVSLWSSVFLTLSAMAAAFLLHRHFRIECTPIVDNENPERRTAEQHPLTSKIILISILLSGVASFGYEIAWTRVLVLIVGSSTYAFTITVAVFILGTAGGSLWISRQIDHFRSPLEVFIHTQIGIAVLAFFTLYLYGQMPEIYMQLIGSTNSPSAIFFVQVLIAVLIMLPPALLIGASFPLAVRLLDMEYAAQEKSFGVTFGLISVGNVLGVGLTTFALIPLLGLQKSTIALGGINLFAATLLLLSFPLIRGRLLLGVAIFVIPVLIMVFQPQWDPVLMTSGTYAKLPVYQKLTGSEKHFRNLLKLRHLKYYKESKENVVSVVEMPAVNAHPYYALAIDGKVDASTGSADMGTQVLSGHLPFILDRNPEKVLVIGLASGITAGTVALHSPQELTVVEIEPAMKEAAAVFGSFNHNVLENPRVKFIFDDGRHYLNMTAQKYDLIISEPSNPWMSGPSRLFTREFYRTVRSRLEAGGLFVQWVPLYGMGKPYFTSLIYTFREAFPQILAFQVSPGDLLFIGSNNSDDSLKISVQQLMDLFNNPTIKTDLALAGVNTPGSLLSHWMGTETMLESISPHARLNTDDNGFVEFGAPKTLYQNTLEANLALLHQSQNVRQLLSHLHWDVPERSRQELLSDFGEQLLRSGKEQMAEVLVDYLNENGELAAAAYLSAQLAERRQDVPAAISNYEKVIRYADGFRETPWRLIQLYLKTNRTDAAERLLERIPVNKRTPDFYYWLGVVHLRQNQPQRAMTSFSKVHVSELKEPAIFYFMNQFVAAGRVGDAHLPHRFERAFRRALRLLRQAAENDQSLDQIQNLINALEPGNTWLTEDEQRKLEGFLVSELLSPLQLYNSGVNALLAGNFVDAETSFNRVLAGTPEQRAASKAAYFMELIQSANTN